MAQNDAMSGLLLRLKDDTVELVESEIALVKAEIFDRLNTLQVSMVPIGVGVFAGVTACLSFATALVLAVGDALDGRYALAAVLVGLGFSVASGVGLAIGGKLIHKVTQPPMEIARKAPVHALEVRHESVQRNTQA